MACAKQYPFFLFFFFFFLSHIHIADARKNRHMLLLLQTFVSPVSTFATIYQKSLNEAKIPHIWKCANVTAIFKNGVAVAS